jgi:hypothetical protein
VVNTTTDGPSQGALHPPKRQSRVMLSYVARWDGTTSIKRLCILACQPQFIEWYRRQASPSISAPTWKNLAAKRSKAKQGGGISRDHLGLQPCQRGRARKTAERPSTNSTADISSLVPHSSCTLTQVVE